MRHHPGRLAGDPPKDALIRTLSTSLDDIFYDLMTGGRLRTVTVIPTVGSLEEGERVLFMAGGILRTYLRHNNVLYYMAWST
jgi:hypothetical protein